MLERHSTDKQTALAISAWENGVDVLDTLRRENSDAGAVEDVSKYLCNICFYCQKLGKHAEAMASIDRLASLNCTRSRFETAAGYMTSGRRMVQGRDPALADEYEQRARMLLAKAQTAQ